jgi:hypothetical protein
VRNITWIELLIPLGVIVAVALYMASLAPS